MTVMSSGIGAADDSAVGPSPAPAAVHSDGSADTPLMTQVLDLLNKKDKRVSAATKLVQLVKDDGAELFHDAERNGYISFSANGPASQITYRQTWPVNSDAMANYLGRLFHAAEHRLFPAQARYEAITQLGADARFTGPELPVGLRVAGHEGKIYLDLVDPLWRAVEIDSEGWRVVDHPPVRFRRAPTMQPLPEPVSGGSIDELRQFANVESETDFQLLVGWLLGALNPRGPYPLLSLTGEHGSGKTLLARLARGLVDPDWAETVVGLSTLKDIAIMARNTWVCSLDNLSYLSSEHSNFFCCLATGAGVRSRTLFTNTEETVFRVSRPTLLTSIADVVSRADLLDRTVAVRLQSVSPSARRTEEDILSAYHSARPRILGALLSGVSHALAHVAQVQALELPRMADFAKWVIAAEPPLGWSAGSFLSAYNERQQNTSLGVLEGSIIVEPMKSLLASALAWPAGSLCNREAGVWVGTATELKAQLENVTGESVRKSKDWPRQPNKLSSALRNIEPNLRAIGIHMVQRLRSSDGGKRLILISRNHENLMQEVNKVKGGSGG
jgi:hypothetical protein